MSLKAMVWVFENSPYKLGARLVHLALADKANEDHDNQLWMYQQKIADKAAISVSQVGRILKKMIEDGAIEVIEKGGGRGNPAVYRLVMEDPKTPHIAGVSEPENPASATPKTPHPRQENPASEQSAPIVYSREHKRDNTKADDEVVVQLCEYLQRGIIHHRGSRKPPKISTQWSKDMDLLLRRGPTTWDTPGPIPEEEIRGAIRRIYTRLNQRGRDGFCWADVIQSPTNLRQHWDRITLALRNDDRPTSDEARQQRLRPAGKLRDLRASLEGK